MSGTEAPKWGYDNSNGPHTWCRHFPRAIGSHQSPVNIDTGRAEFTARLNNPPMNFSYHHEMLGCTLANTGSSFQVANSNGSDFAYITGGPLPSKYQFEQLHMHWGAGNNWGSEHALNGRLFPAELHLVHWNSNKFATFQEAAAIKDGLAVLGVFVEVGAEHPHLQQFIDQFAGICEAGSRVSLSCGLSLSKLLPDRTDDFFTYEGSLTTPPCFESVLWIVFRQPITMSEEQLQSLRSLRFHSGPMVDNYRPLIPLGSRKLLASCHPSDQS